MYRTDGIPYVDIINGPIVNNVERRSNVNDRGPGISAWWRFPMRLEALNVEPTSIFSVQPDPNLTSADKC